MSERLSPTYYDVLGIWPDAAPDAVKQAWRRLVRDLHPDRGGSAAAFDAVQRAYDTLRDPNSRAEYDRSLRAGRRVQIPYEPAHHRPPPRSNPTPPVQESVRPVRRVVLPDHAVPPLNDDLLPAHSVLERVLWCLSVTALLGLVAIVWLDGPGSVDSAVVVSVCVGVVLVAGIGTSRSREGVGFLTVSWLLAVLATVIFGPDLFGELTGFGEPSHDPLVAVAEGLVVGGTVGTSSAATVTRRRRKAARRLRQRYAQFVADLDERRRRAERWVPVATAQQRAGAGLWWISFAATLPGVGLTSVVLHSPDGAYRVPAFLWGEWPQRTWVVVDSATGQVLASAPEAARAAWIDLWDNPRPTFSG
jgi:hypothetical protein